MDGRKKVYRGGSYNSPIDEIGSFIRFAAEPENHAAYIGFRCVLSSDQIENPTYSIGQPCQVISMNELTELLPTSTPFPCSSATVNGYCQLLGGKPSYGIELLQSNCLNNSLHSMMANLQPLTCSTISLSDGSNKYECTFPDMAQGINVNMNYCHEIDIPVVQKACPIGYQYDKNKNLCAITETTIPNPPCPKGFLEVGSFGCLQYLIVKILHVR
jgi:hypothetical protein